MNPEDRRLDELPDHERDDDVSTSGGGIMSEGGTAIDRGTGALGGIAQGGDPDEAADAPDDPRGEREGDPELDMSSIAYGAAARGSMPSAPISGSLPEAGFVPEQDGEEAEPSDR